MTRPPSPSDSPARDLPRQLEGIARRDFLRGLAAASLAIPALAGCERAENPGASPSSPGTNPGGGNNAAAPKFRAAFSCAGLVSTWSARGLDTAKFFGNRLGVEITVFDGQLSVPKQRADLETIASQDWDFVAVQPLAVGAYLEPARQIIAKGTPLIDMDTRLADDLDKLGVATFIEPDHLLMGLSVTRALVDKIGRQGNVVHTQGALTHTGAQARAKGFHSVVDAIPAIHVIDESPGDWDPVKTRQIWEDLLARYPSIQGAMFHNDDMALAAYGAIKASGREKEIALVGVDGMQPAIRAVMDGQLVSTMVNPTGRIHSTALFAGWTLANKSVNARTCRSSSAPMARW